MDFQQLIDSIDPETYEKLKLAVETGKWANGTRLSIAQREQSLQAVIAYDQKHKPEDERVGFIHSKKQGFCGPKEDAAESQPVKILK